MSYGLQQNTSFQFFRDDAFEFVELQSDLREIATRFFYSYLQICRRVTARLSRWSRWVEAWKFKKKRKHNFSRLHRISCRFSNISHKLYLFYSILFYPITLGGCRGTTDEFATIPFHLDLFSAALVELARSIPVHSLILSSHLFFCLPLFSFSFHCAL